MADRFQAANQVFLMKTEQQLNGGELKQPLALFIHSPEGSIKKTDRITSVRFDSGLGPPNQIVQAATHWSMKLPSSIQDERTASRSASPRRAIS